MYVLYGTVETEEERCVGVVCNMVGKIHSFNQEIFIKHLSYESNMLEIVGQYPKKQIQNKM